MVQLRLLSFIKQGCVNNKALAIPLDLTHRARVNISDVGNIPWIYLRWADVGNIPFKRGHGPNSHHLHEQWHELIQVATFVPAVALTVAS